MDFSPTVAVLQAKLQAWCVNLLSIPVDAYQLGAVIGKGASIRTAEGDTLWPDVVFVATADSKTVTASGIQGAPLLAIDIIYSQLPESQRRDLRLRYSRAHVLEYWQVEADRAAPIFFQANALGEYDLIPPDQAGIHYSTAIVELSFPVHWFHRQPDLWTMMAYWGMIQDLQ